MTVAMVSPEDLFHACETGNVEVIPRLLEVFDPSADDNRAIIKASDNGHAAVVQLLLADPRVDPSAERNYAIRTASFNGHAAVVKLLLADPRVDPRACRNHAIRCASGNGHAAVVELLLADPRVKPSACHNQAIRLASFDGHATVVQLLLAHPRVDPSAESNYAIGYACRQGHSAVVQLLLAHPKVEPNDIIIQKTFGETCLSAEFFLAASSSTGLAKLMPLADMTHVLTPKILDILISRANGIQSNQMFLHSLRLTKFPIPAEVRVSYGDFLDIFQLIDQYFQIFS